MRPYLSVTTAGGVAIALSVAILLALPSADAHAQPQPSPHFRLPFDTPPGFSTWYVIQFYGNTGYAYANRNALYVQSQGLHSGVDFGAPCGTQVVAIGDGTVVEVDNPAFGLAPHELTIRHPQGYLSFYGHLLEKPRLGIGAQVRASQPIALTGDPDGTCHSRPHLHLEIRDLTYRNAYNPVTLIDADWNTLALFGSYQPDFETNVDSPRQWVSPAGQPDLRFNGPLVNDYAHPWPPAGW